MDRDEAVKLLRGGEEGIAEWNLRRSKREQIPLLDGADLSHADLSGANLSGANLSNADLGGADLGVATLIGANLTGANLTAANLAGANFSNAELRDANLSNADLWFAIFGNTMLENANLGGAILAFTKLANVDLSTAKGLDEALHDAGSTIGIDTIYQSARMRENKLRVWYAPEDMKAGRKIHEQIDSAIRLHDKLLVVLSDHSMQSEWVKTEVRHARQREVKEGRRVLFPIRLVPFETIRDWNAFDADTGKDMAVEIREYFIPDFSNWKDHDSFEEAFARLLRDLSADDTENERA